MEYLGISWNIIKYHGISWNIMELSEPGQRHLKPPFCLQGPDLGKEAIRRLSGFTVSGRSVLDDLGICWKSYDHGISLNIMECHGMSWNVMEYHGISWNIMEYHRLSWISWNIMEYHTISWNIMEYHGIS